MQGWQPASQAASGYGTQQIREKAGNTVTDRRGSKKQKGSGRERRA